MINHPALAHSLYNCINGLSGRIGTGRRWIPRDPTLDTAQFGSYSQFTHDDAFRFVEFFAEQKEQKAAGAVR